MTPQPTITIPATEYEDMKRRLAHLERIVRDYMMRCRESSIQEMSHVEDALELPRTKPKKNRESINLSIKHLQNELRLIDLDERAHQSRPR